MAAPGVQVTGINHVVLHVSNLERSLHFYVDLLGFEDRHVDAGTPGKASFLRAGLQGLDLFEVAEDVHAGQEMNHMALNVEVDDADQLVERLTAAGIRTSAPNSRNSVMIRDPDGHRLEMLPLNATNRARERQETAAPA